LQAPAAEPALVQALLRSDGAVRVAAAEALGRAGSAAAVMPLREAFARFKDSDLYRAVRQAVAEIQSRVSGTPGSLSLAEDQTGGQLSIVESAGGQVSLADDEPDR
jgi:HEAT repeat protein